MPLNIFARVAALTLTLALSSFVSASAQAQQADAAPVPHHHGAAQAQAPATAAPPVFVASSAKPFAALMDDAMAVMDDGMRRAPMNGRPDHDFLTMMLPHHQGAVDMARAVLLSTTDPEIRNLALGIIAEQQNEIRVMQAWLTRHPQSPQ
jgi:hypothetical protein